MASCVRNICSKNRQNPLILLKVTIDNVGVPFIETQCTIKYFADLILLKHNSGVPDDNVFHSTQDLSSHSASSQGKVSHILHIQNAAKHTNVIENTHEFKLKKICYKYFAETVACDQQLTYLGSTTDLSKRSEPEICINITITKSAI